MVSLAWTVDNILMLQTIQSNGYNIDSLKNGPKSSWLGYSLLPEGATCFHPPAIIQEEFQNMFVTTDHPPGSKIEFPLLFTENPGFDVRRFLVLDKFDVVN